LFNKLTYRQFPDILRYVYTPLKRAQYKHIKEPRRLTVLSRRSYSTTEYQIARNPTTCQTYLFGCSEICQHKLIINTFVPLHAYVMDYLFCAWIKCRSDFFIGWIKYQCITYVNKSLCFSYSEFLRILQMRCNYSCIHFTHT